MPYNISWYRLNTKTSPEIHSQPNLEPISFSPQIMIDHNNSLLFLSPDISDEGWYICKAENKGGQSSERVYLSVHQTPVVRVSPSNFEFTAGSNLNIQCHVVSGIPYPSITWKKDNHIVQDIEESNDNTHWTLKLRDLQRKDQGLYSCEATNVVGTAYGTAELSLLEHPKARLETSSQLIKQGDSALLRCYVSGSPTPQLVWYKDLKIISPEEQSRFQILQNGTLKIEHVNEEDSGQYACVARNKVGTSRDSTDLQVGVPPHLIHRPTDLAVPIGGFGSILCAAMGFPVPQISWTKNGIPINHSRTFVSDQGEFFIKDARLEDEGNYSCTVENTFGKLMYNVTIKITGIVTPRLMKERQPANMKAMIGRYIELRCPILQGNPPPTRSWYKDDFHLDTALYQINAEGSLIISNISVADKGLYKCVVSNVGGEDILTINLDVLVPPKIMKSEQDTEVRAVEGNSVTLLCPVTGQPAPSVSWLRSGKRLLPFQQNGTSLLLSNVTIYQSGAYTCLAINTAGSDARSVNLHVLVPPKITQWKENLRVNEGHYVRLECYVTADPPANISWYHEQTLLPFHTSIIRFPVNKTMEGQYKCVAENEVGSSTQLVNLFVSVVPRIDPLTPTKRVAIAGEQVILTCPSSGEPKPTVTWSKLGVKLKNQVNDDGSVILTHLTPSDAGTYLCSASNSAGSALLPVSLDVLVRPVITEWEEELSVLEGQSISLSCNVEGHPPANITWLKNEVLYKYGSELKFNVERNDAGNYTCVAQNEAGIDKQNLVLSVAVPAYILENDEELVQLSNNIPEAQLICHADGVPQPQVSWIKNSINLTEKTEDHIRVDGSILTIINPSQKVAGTYICHAENPDGIAQKIFQVEFFESPKILDKNPTNIILREGEDYTIPCTATGIPIPSINWQLGAMTLSPGFQNEELVVMPDKTLVLTQVSSASQGLYSCVAENPAGLAQRNYSIHIVVPPVAVDNSVTHLEIVESNEALLTCPVHQGTPQPSVQWLKDAVPISFVQNERADETHYNLKDGGRSLKIVEARSDDGGLYTCIATNLAGRSQALFNVNVLVHPHFINELYENEFTQSEGEKLVLDCSVGGNPEPKISWKRVESGFPLTQHTTPGIMLELPTRRKLIIPAVRPHHSGTYQCTAINKLGRESRKFSVQVTAPPELEGPIEEYLEAVVNETIALHCKVWGSPHPVINWDYANQTSDFQRIENKGFDLMVLELSHVTVKYSGLYRCTARNILGSVSKLFNVSISEPPLIEKSQFIEELKVSVGGELTLVCDISGSPMPIVSWLHNGHVIANQSLVNRHQYTLKISPITTRTGGKYSCIASNKAGVSEILWLKDGKKMNRTDEHMIINNSKLSDAGNYTCTAYNHVGSVSKTFIVDVYSPPVLNSQDSVQTVEVLSKSTVVLNCSSKGHPTPSVMWLKGSRSVSHTAAQLSDNNQTLTLYNVSSKHSGDYLCLASNIAGAVEKMFNVEVLEPPSVTVSDEADRSNSPPLQRVEQYHNIKLQCQVSGTPQPKITWYKDGQLLSGHQVTMIGQLLHIMNALPKHGGNYSCVAENPAGTTQLFFPVNVVVPLQWTEWTPWTPCSKTCGGGKEVRERQCGPNATIVMPFVEMDTSDCAGDKIQSRPCNVLPCQVHGSWSEWTSWTSCSESCGKGTRRRYRSCDSPAPAFGGDPCLGSDGQQETCMITPCPIESQWGEWTRWSDCSARCGKGTKFRARLCYREAEVVEDCDGLNQEVASCFNRKCPVNGKWSPWSSWSQCSVSCGRGVRQRHRLCSKHFNGGKPCVGDNIQIEKCHMPNCKKPSFSMPKSASLHIRGKLNGKKVEDMYLDAHVQQEGPKRRVTATLNDILKAQAKWFPYLTFLMPPVPWNTASAKGNNIDDNYLTSGNFTEESRLQFATGHELVVKHTGKGIDNKGTLKVDIEVLGEVPLLQPTSTVVISPYTEDYVQTGPNSLFTSSNSSFNVDGEKLPFEWNRTMIYNDEDRSNPYLVERLSTDEISSGYSAKDNQFYFNTVSEISNDNQNNQCPIGFKFDSNHNHCTDIDECKESKKSCQKNQICENEFGSYSCHCQPGFRLTSSGDKCVDVNECVESKPCSHNCHNTRGSFYCSCPPQLALSHSGHTCKAWGELDMEETEELSNEGDYIEIDTNEDFQYLDARPEEVVACKPGLLWLKGSCSDIDECAQDYACGEEETCINTYGSYHCLKTPCYDSIWDQLSRSCIKTCDESKDSCSESTHLAEFTRYKSLTLNSTTLQPYQDLFALQPVDLQNDLLSHNVYDITDNEQGIPLRIRISNTEGVLYAMKYYEVNGIQRLTIKASSFSKDYKTELYITNFVVFLYAEEHG